jgi:hypothetical protein
MASGQGGVANLPARAQSGTPAAQSGPSGATGATTPLAGMTAAGRQVVRTATVQETVPDVSVTVNRVQQFAAAAGGYVATEYAQADDATITLQVPEPKLDAVLGQLDTLGRVTGRQQQAQDVTDQLVDVQSRISSQQASVARVRALMDQASSLADVVDLEGELTTRETALESLERQQDELAGQVAMSTVTVQLAATVPPVPVASASTPGFLGGLAGGWRAFLSTVRVAGAVLGAVLPFGLVLGVPALVVWLVWRRRRATVQAGSSVE